MAGRLALAPLAAAVALAGCGGGTKIDAGKAESFVLGGLETALAVTKRTPASIMRRARRKTCPISNRP